MKNRVLFLSHGLSLSDTFIPLIFQFFNLCNCFSLLVPFFVVNWLLHVFANTFFCWWHIFFNKFFWLYPRKLIFLLADHTILLFVHLIGMLFIAKNTLDVIEIIVCCSSRKRFYCTSLCQYTKIYLLRLLLEVRDRITYLVILSQSMLDIHVAYYFLSMHR